MGDNFVLHGKLAAGNDLTACAGFEVDDDRCFQIESEARVGFSDDDHDLGLPHVGQRQGCEFAAGNPYLIVGDKPAWADNGQRDIAAGRETVGDTTTLEDYTVLAKLRDDE